MSEVWIRPYDAVGLHSEILQHSPLVRLHRGAPLGFPAPKEWAVTNPGQPYPYGVFDRVTVMLRADHPNGDETYEKIMYLADPATADPFILEFEDDVLSVGCQCTCPKESPGRIMGICHQDGVEFPKNDIGHIAGLPEFDNKMAFVSQQPGVPDIYKLTLFLSDPTDATGMTPIAGRFYVGFSGWGAKAELEPSPGP